MTFSSSVAALLEAIVLLCAFLQISGRRIIALLTLSQISALALGVASVFRGFVWREISLFGVALLIFSAQFFVLPYLIRHMMRDFGTDQKLNRAVPLIWSMIIGLLPVGLAVAGMASMAKTPLSSEAGVMAIAFAVILLGLWLMIIQNQLPAQMIGFITLENGLVLGLINVEGLAWAADIAVVTLLGLMICLVVVGRWRRHAPPRVLADGADS